MLPGCWRQQSYVILVTLAHLSGMEHDTGDIVDMSAQRVNFPCPSICTHIHMCQQPDEEKLCCF